MVRRNTVLLAAALLLVPLALAANDPGHDSLYVLKFGDSSVVGSINITNALNASNIYASALLYGDQLDIRANGSILAVTNRPAMQSDSEDLYLDSKNNIYFATKGGTTGFIQMGPLTGSAITLNVSGTIRQQGVAVCLSNGTNCLTGENTGGNITTIDEGEGITVTNPNGPTVTVAVDATVCRSDGTNCPTTSVLYQSSAAGWTNTSTTTSTALDVDVNSGKFFVNATSGRIGVGTAAPLPTSRLTVYQQQSDTLAAYFGHADYAGATTGTFTQGGAVDVFAAFNGTATDVWYGVNTYPAVLGGTVTAFTGVYAGAYQEDGSITNMSALRTALAQYGGTTAAAYSLLVENLQHYGGTTTNQYGVYIDNQTGSTNNYNLYSSGSQARNIFEGNVGIGTTLPTQKLDVNGSINVSGAGGKLHTPELCLNGNCQTSWPTGSGGGGGWTNDTTSTWTALRAIVNSSSGDGSLIVQNQTGSAHLFVNGSSGFVGVGTTAAPSVLSLASSTSQEGGIAFGSDVKLYRENTNILGMASAGNALFNILAAPGGYHAGVRLAPSNGGGYSLVDFGGAGLLFRADNVNVVMFINNSASPAIGIGTSSPAKTLDVNGTSGFTGNTTFTMPAGSGEVCFERFVGTTQNYTRCINATGQVTERFGSFVIN